jgi:hypothetical protein
MISFILISLVGISSIFFYVALRDLNTIKNNWSKYRCNPLYMPLAYMDGGFEGVGTNFENCIALIGKSVVGQMNDALGSQFSIIGEILGGITNPLSIFRSVFSMMNKFILSFTTTTLGKASGPLSSFVYYLNKIQDLIRRMVGEGYIAAFFGVSMVSFMEGFISLVISIIEGFIKAMLIIAVILALFQPTILVITLSLASALYASGA